MWALFIKTDYRKRERKGERDSVKEREREREKERERERGWGGERGRRKSLHYTHSSL